MNLPSTSNPNQQERNTLSQPQIKANPREMLLQNLLNGSLILGTILFFLNVFNAFQNRDYLAVGIIFLAYGIVFMVTFARMLPYHLRTSALTTAYFMTGIISLLQSGVNSNSLLYFLIAVLILAVLEEGNYWIILSAISIFTVTILDYFFQSGVLAITGSFLQKDSNLYWISVIVNFVFLMVLIASPLSQYSHKINANLRKISTENDQLNQDILGLRQEKVNTETTLDQRKLRLVTTRQISREISRQTDLDKLLDDSTELIRTQLGYQFVAIYLTDERHESASIRSASGEGSQLLLSRKFRVKVHEQGPISTVIAHGESHIESDLSAEEDKKNTSIVPNTLSQIIVPLRVGQHIIGALDVQSNRRNAFADEDLEMLQTIADQLTVVIDKTTRIKGLEEQVINLQQSYRSFTQGTWRSHLEGTNEQLNFTFAEENLEPEYQPSEVANQALTTAEVVVAAANTEKNPDPANSILSVPIILRDQVLGVMNIRYKGSDIPADLSALVKNASDRLALALENARLLEQIQARADREHLVSEISSRLRAATDVDSILRTTAAELGKSLGIDEVRIQLKNTETK